MKKVLCALSLVFLLVSCHQNAVEKPGNLIDEDKMVDIFYDLSIMEAMKSQSPYAPEQQSANPKAYIFKKYKIDSLQFTLSNRYYISQIEQYKKMYEKVGERIEAEKKAAESKQNSKTNKLPATSNPEAGQVQ